MVEYRVAKGLPPELKIIGFAGRGFHLAVEVGFPVIEPGDLGLLVVGTEVGAGLQNERKGNRHCRPR